MMTLYDNWKDNGPVAQALTNLGISPIGEDVYWTSTEYDDTYAWVISFYKNHSMKYGRYGVDYKDAWGSAYLLALQIGSDADSIQKTTHANEVISNETTEDFSKTDFINKDTFREKNGTPDDSVFANLKNSSSGSQEKIVKSSFTLGNITKITPDMPINR